jgi:nucleotide-binding universal stress UspA family protein
MSAIADPFVIRRILVALDASTHSLAALEAAVELAERVEAEIEGVFVEDINLMRLAELPIALQLSLPTGLQRRIDAAVIEQEMRALAAEARKALETAAERTHVRWTFRVVRGRVEAELTAAAGEADLVVLDTASRPLTQYARLVSAADVAKLAPRSVLLLRGRPGPARSVIVAYDGSKGAEKALAAAARIAAALKRTGIAEPWPNLTVLALGATEDAARKAEKKAKAWLAREGVEAAARRLIGAGPAEVCEAVRRMGSGLLVLDAGAPLIQRAKAETLLDESGCPILLVR